MPRALSRHPRAWRAGPGAVGGSELGDGLAKGAGTWDLGAMGSQVLPGLTAPRPILFPVEPLSGNLVEKDCVESCSPTYSMQGQVSSGSATTLCCQSDLCNEKLQTSAATRTLLTSATLGLALALGLLALLWGPSL